jgi:hypothetical protein
MADTNPFTLDYQQFLQAMQPYAAANGGSYNWNSPEGQNGSVGLTLANGKTWAPSGAASGVEFIPKGTKKYIGPNPGSNKFERSIGDPYADPANYAAPTSEDTWKISGDMSALLGQNDTNAHKTIEYRQQDGKLIPTKTEDWQNKNTGFGGFLKDALSTDAFKAFGLLTGASMLGGLGGAGSGLDAAGGALGGADAAANAGLAYGGAADAGGGLLSGAAGLDAAGGAIGGAQAAADAGLAYANGLTAADIAAMGGSVGGAAGFGNVVSSGSGLLSGLGSIGTVLKDNAGLIGAGLGAIASGQDQTQSTTASKEPWAAAAPWMKQNLATGQKLQDYYQNNPFNDQQKSSYQNLFTGIDNFNQNTMPALTDFANRGMNTAYQRPTGGAVGSGGGYGGAVQPGGLMGTGGRGLTAPQMQSLGQIDWTKVNPFAKV